MLAKLNALHAVRRNVGRDLLVGDAFVLPQDLQRQRRKEILILVADHKQRPPQRAVGIRSDVKEAIRRRGFGQFRKIGLHSRSHRSPALNPCPSHIKIGVAGFDFQDLREGLRPSDVEKGFGQLGIGKLGALRAQKKMAENYVSGVFECGCELGVDIGLLLQLLNFILQIGRRGRSDFASQARQHGKSFAAGRGWECHVEGNNPSTFLFQLTYQNSVVASRQRVGPDRLQRLFVNANDDDARIRNAPAPHGKAKIERTLLDVLQKQKAGTLIAADSRISEEGQTDGRHRHRNGGVGLLREPSGYKCELHPIPANGQQPAPVGPHFDGGAGVLLPPRVSAIPNPTPNPAAAPTPIKTLRNV